jgi:hypothetical protein
VVDEINRVLGEEGKAPLTAREEAIYRLIVATLKQTTDGSDSAWMNLRPDNGPGRIDAFDAVKFEVIGAPDDGSAGQVDFPSLWNQAPEMRPWHHWDGNTRSSQARNRGSTVGVGGIAMSLNKVGIDAIGAWLDRGLPVPAYPFTPPDPGEVARGLQVFTSACASCHGLYDREARKVREAAESQYMERVKPGTDTERSKAFLKPAADALNDFGERRNLWEKDAFRPVVEEGEYLCGPLDGIWARAPYLHNGSVPTLADLLRPPAPKGSRGRAEAQRYRPKRFYRGNRRYDEGKVGWVSTEPTEGARVLFEYRTVDESDQPIPGNSNAGHTYGTELPEQDKSALLAYLKTL